MVIQGGEVRLVGTLDTSSIERSQRRVATGFEDMKSKSSNTSASLAGLRNIGQNLAGTFSAVSTAGLGALSGLATTAPQTAGALASISASTKQLSILAGEELAPAFDMAAEKYSQFVDFLGSGSPMSELVKDISYLAGAGGVATVAGKLAGLKNIGKITIPVTLAVTAASASDEVAGVGQRAGESLATSLGAPEGGFSENALGDAGSIFGTALTGTVGGAAAGSVIPGVGTVAGGVVGGVAGFGYGVYDAVRREFFTTDTTGGNSGG